MRKGEQTRAAVLDRALAMSTETGLEAVTIGVLAKKMKLSKSGLFAHFASKENLQIAVLEKAVERFREILAPAFRAPRGEPRVRAIFEKTLEWERSDFMPGGCIFVNVANELGNRPGPVRDVLVTRQQEMLAAVRKAGRMAIEEGHFKADLDLEQFAYDFYANVLCYHHYRHVLELPDAVERYHGACEQLIERSRA